MSAIPTDAIRGALIADLLGALDYAESVHRGLGHTSARLLDMTDASYAELCRCAENAYNTLCAARVLAEARP